MKTKTFALWVIAVLATIFVASARSADKLPNVVVLASGGIIAGASASDVQASYTSGQLGVDQLIAAVERRKTRSKHLRQ